MTQRKLWAGSSVLALSSSSFPPGLMMSVSLAIAHCSWLIF